ncbi:galactoside 2-alpha-L-fucosyltransferase Sec1-like isoform X2 [Watersipora subatra]
MMTRTAAFAAGNFLSCLSLFLYIHINELAWHPTSPTRLVPIDATRANPELIIKLSRESLKTDRPKEKELFITVSEKWLCKSVRLGNKMCMLSSAIATAASRNITFVMSQSHRPCNWIIQLRQLFANLKFVKQIPSTVVKKWHTAKENGPYLYSKIPDGRNVSITGYRQSWKYFRSKEQQAAIRKAFTFTTRYENFANQNLAKARQSYIHIENPILIGLHMRIGDLVTVKSGKRLATKAFYDAALYKAFLHFNKSPAIIFVAASDSPKLAKKMLSDAAEKYNIFWSSGTAFEDMATLSKCNNSIISGGTFGFWTAWLAGGVTFYNANASLPDSPFSRRYIESNFILPSWISVAWV